MLKCKGQGEEGAGQKSSIRSGRHPGDEGWTPSTWEPLEQGARTPIIGVHPAAHDRTMVQISRSPDHASAEICTIPLLPVTFTVHLHSRAWLWCSNLRKLINTGTQKSRAVKPWDNQGQVSQLGLSGVGKRVGVRMLLILMIVPMDELRPVVQS